MRISDWSSDVCSSDLVPPDGIGSIAAMNAWHDVHDGRWMEFVPPQNPAFAANWLARQKDMVEKYRPDMVYLDDTGLPFGSYGIEALEHYYAQGRDADGGLDENGRAHVGTPVTNAHLV